MPRRLPHRPVGPDQRAAGCPSPQPWRLGITDHVWTTTELLSYRVPTDFLDQLPELEPLFPAVARSHHGN